MILFFDTETTGLVPGRIIQLSYIMLDGNGTRAKNFFFGVDYIEPSAVAVHHFTVEKLSSLSNGHTFSTDIDEIEKDFSQADLIVAHNARFDIDFLIAEFNYQDRRFRYKEYFDTMKKFTPIVKMPRANGKGYKYPKLTELAEFFDIYPYDINRNNAKLFNCLLLDSHDARYDTTALYMCFEEGAKIDEETKKLRNKYVLNCVDDENGDVDSALKTATTAE